MTDIINPDAVPICGEDMCDRCGDCLHCYAEDPCINGGSHLWVVYAEKVDAFTATHQGPPT
jgi:hypothetical protein